MTEKEVKEIIKKVIENHPQYSEQMKIELKTIIELEKTLESAFYEVLLYLSARGYA